MTPTDRLALLLGEAGAVAFGTAPAQPVEDAEWRRFEDWLAAGRHAGMTYMERYREIRRDPRLLLEGARSIVSVAFNYRQPNPYPEIATYALGEDYHKVLRHLLKGVTASMKSEFGGEWRVCIDSAPVLERYWAVRTGVGRRSDFHGNVIVEGAGSMVFLAELVTTLDLDEAGRNFIEQAQRKAAGPSTAPCRSVCPSGALMEGGTVDSRRCINYLTIEHTASLTEEEREMVGRAVFGCDICQRVCAENRGEAPEVLDAFKPLPGLGDFLRGEEGRFDLERSPIKRKFRKNKNT